MRHFLDRLSRRLPVLLLALALPGAMPAWAGAVIISYAEQPVRLLRGTTLYSAGRGTTLQNGDLLDSGGASVQIDGIGAATLALGPASRVYLALGPGTPAVQLLDGWLKLQAGKAATDTDTGAAPGIASGALQVLLHGGAVIVRHDAGATALFVEDGVASVTETAPGKPARSVKVGREQYAVRSAKAPLAVLARAPQPFLGALPVAFRDSLAPLRVNGAAPAPVRQAQASYAQVAPWLADAPALRLVMQRRFYPPAPKKPPPPAYGQASPAPH